MRTRPVCPTVGISDVSFKTGFWHRKLINEIHYCREFCHRDLDLVLLLELELERLSEDEEEDEEDELLVLYRLTSVE